jgi:hypothetical protein
MAKRPTNSPAASETLPPGDRELIVIAEPTAGLRATGVSVSSTTGFDTSNLASLLTDAGAAMRPLFGDSEDRVRTSQQTLAAAAADLPDLSTFYKVDADDELLDGLAKQLRAKPGIAAAYVKPPAYPAAAVGLAEAAPPFQYAPPNIVDAPPATPDLTAREIYLNAAPAGIDARYAWTLPGGRGAGVRIIDVEGAWNFAHEDLLQNQGGILGNPINDLAWRNHGTAVMGEIGGDVNAIGITGICPDAVVQGVTIFPNVGSAAAIRAAADRLGPGDIILIELHRPGPRFNFQGRADQRGFIAVEWWPDDYAAIRYAVTKDVIVVEAGGNGAENLDDAIYNNPAPGFPADWRNPFDRAQRDSGAILVGAGAPPPGTHGRDHGPDRSRLDFSNYGSAIDCQGWGREVTTTGYGDLQGGASENLWYTDVFSGTSSASPIIVGTLGCLQGIMRARSGLSRIPLNPTRARDLLRSTGSPQQDAPGRPRAQRIGNRPNLRQLVPAAAPVSQWIGVQWVGQVPAQGSQTWFTYNWPAHWHVLWTVQPLTPGVQIEWKLRVERSSDRYVTYWITVTNLGNQVTNIEGRFAVVGW